METIHERLEQLKNLYQQRVSHSQELEEEISNYFGDKEKRDGIRGDLYFNRAYGCFIFLDLLTLFLTIGITSPIVSIIGWSNIELLISIGIFIPASVMLLGITFLLEENGILEKIARKFTPKKYAELDQFNLSLEKVNIKELKQQLTVSEEKEMLLLNQLKSFQKEAEKLSNIPSEEDITLEYQRKLEERKAQIEEFFKSRVLSKEELVVLESAIEKRKVKQ